MVRPLGGESPSNARKEKKERRCSIKKNAVIDDREGLLISITPIAEKTKTA